MLPNTTSVVYSSIGVDKAESTPESGGHDSDDDIDISVLEQLESMCWSVEHQNPVLKFLSLEMASINHSSLMNAGVVFFLTLFIAQIQLN